MIVDLNTHDMDEGEWICSRCGVPMPACEHCEDPGPCTGNAIGRVVSLEGELRAERARVADLERALVELQNENRKLSENLEDERDCWNSGRYEVMDG